MNSTQSNFNILQIGIILLALATAAIHLSLAISSNLIMFYLNAIGYVVLVIALYLPQLRGYQSIIRWVLIGYTTVTVIGWVVIGARNSIAYIDKLIELALIGLLWIESRQD